MKNTRLLKSAGPARIVTGLLPSLAFGFLAQSSGAAETLKVTVTNDLKEARPAETITVPWSAITAKFPGSLPNRILVKDSTGAVVPSQLLNPKPEEHSDNYESVIFQHDFAAGEQKAVFTITATDAPIAPYPTKVFARHIPERYDDFAWENDLIAFRTYGPALGTPSGGRDQMVSSGIDIWSKRVHYPIVDRWYLMGHYHDDTGEGMDLYETGKTRGCGGTGVWDGKQLFTSQNWKSYKVIANGPVRTSFELYYDFWEAGGVKVSETKTFSLDAGSQFVKVEAEYKTEPAGAPITIAVGVAKHTKNIASASPNKDEKAGWISLWETYTGQGKLGTGVILPAETISGYAEDKLNYLLLTKPKAGEKVRYYLGGAWDKATTISDQKAWETYLAATAVRLASPVKVVIE